MTDPRWQQPAHGVWTRTIRGIWYEIELTPVGYVVRPPGFLGFISGDTLTAAKRAALKHAKENGK